MAVPIQNTRMCYWFLGKLRKEEYVYQSAIYFARIVTKFTFATSQRYVVYT